MNMFCFEYMIFLFVKSDKRNNTYYFEVIKTLIGIDFV